MHTGMHAPSFQLGLRFKKTMFCQCSHHTVKIYVTCNHFTQLFRIFITNSSMEKLIPQALVAEIRQQF